MNIFPAIDLQEGNVVRLYQGDFNQQTSYGADPVEQAQIFARDGATHLHVIDLDGARTGQLRQKDVIARICGATELHIQVGGGIRTEKAIEDLLSVGVSRCILGTAALRDWSWFSSIVEKPEYHDRLVLGLDARAGKLAVGGWQQVISDEAIDVAHRVSDWPLGAIVYTDISTDGTMQGPNLSAIRQITEATQIPIIASGGVGTLEHLIALHRLPICGAIVGKAIYEQAFTLGEAIAVFKRGG